MEIRITVERIIHKPETEELEEDTETEIIYSQVIETISIKRIVDVVNTEEV